MAIRWLTLILIFTSAVFLTGCWNAREINELAFVMGIAVDEAKDNKVKVTVQMAKPSTFSKSPTGGSGGDKEKLFWVATAEGKTLFEAIRNMATFSSRRIFWSHNKVILIGEKLARRDISNILDFFTRNSELRLRTWVVVVPGEAGQLLEKGPNMEEDPATSMEKVIAGRALTGKSYATMLKDFTDDYLSPATYPVTGKLTVAKGQSQPAIKLEGAAVFEKNKLAGWLDEQETRGYLWLKNTIGNPVLVVPCPSGGEPMSIEVTMSKVDFKSHFKGQQPYLTIMVKTSGNLGEQKCNIDFTKPEKRREIEKALETTISKDIQSAVKAAQQDFGLDYPGFNHIFHRQQNQKWYEIGHRWPQMFKEMEVSIQVEAKLPRVTLFAKPLESMKQPQPGSGEE